MDSFDLMKTRLQYFGGKRELDRIDWQKNNDLEKALKYSEDSEYIQRGEDSFQILISASSSNFEDYDEKVIRSLKINKIKIGDIFFWFRTKTYWMVLSQELQETAIFKGKARRCSPTPIEFDKNILYGVLINPETAHLSTKIIDSRWTLDSTNEVLGLYLPKNEISIKIERYSKLKIGNKYWEVDSVLSDLIQPNLLKISLREDYETIVEPTVPTVDIDGVSIIGEKEISPYCEYTYKINKNTEGDWSINDNSFIKILNKNETEITLEWNSSKKGSFILSYGDIHQEIKARSLF